MSNAKLPHTVEAAAIGSRVGRYVIDIMITVIMVATHSPSKKRKMLLHRRPPLFAKWKRTGASVTLKEVSLELK